VLHDSHDEDHIHLLPLELPVPMYRIAIEPKKRGDEQRISEALHKLAAEDPTFRAEHSSSNETVISGLGELHMRYILERMQGQYHAEINTRPPRIPYRETVSAGAEGHHRHKKQSGGAGQFGEVFLRIEPLARGAGFEFVDQVKGGTIPGQFIPAVEKGVRQVLEAGPVAGYPLQDVRVIVYDGKHHAVDSKEVAFIAAGKRAFLDAIAKARPVMLEPIVRIEIAAPDANMGDIVGDMSARRGHISGTDTIGGGLLVIKGHVPLAELADFHTRLKSITAGRGSFSIELSHHEAVPAAVQAQLAEAHAKAGHAEED
jgi:elongation factor G